MKGRGQDFCDFMREESIYDEVMYMADKRIEDAKLRRAKPPFFQKFLSAVSGIGADRGTDPVNTQNTATNMA